MGEPGRSLSLRFVRSLYHQQISLTRMESEYCERHPRGGVMCADCIEASQRYQAAHRKPKESAKRAGKGVCVDCSSNEMGAWPQSGMCRCMTTILAWESQCATCADKAGKCRGCGAKLT